jgi:hypothetical protein
VKWEARGNQNQNPNQYVQKISVEICNGGPRKELVMQRRHVEELEQGLIRQMKEIILNIGYGSQQVLCHPLILNKKRRLIREQEKKYSNWIRENEHQLCLM